VAVRGRRTDLGLTQATVAARARVSRKWVYEFEAGKPRAELHRMLRVLEALGLELDVAVPEHATASDGGLHDDHAGR
jgi:y4mF family transcriptional regulator